MGRRRTATPEFSALSRELRKIGDSVYSLIASILVIANLTVMIMVFIVAMIFNSPEEAAVVLLKWYLGGLIPFYIHLAVSIGGPIGAIILWKGLKKDRFI